MNSWNVVLVVIYILSMRISSAHNSGDAPSFVVGFLCFSKMCKLSLAYS
jgi:hypothetical protein